MTREPDTDTHSFSDRTEAMRFLARRTFTYENRERGFDLYHGEKFGQRASLWTKDGQWHVSFWQE